jgi:two-component system NarL family response regulator
MLPSPNARSAAPPRRIRVLVVDDNDFTRVGAVSLLQRQPDIEVVGQASRADGMGAFLRELRPHVTVLDLHAPAFDHRARLALQQERNPRAHVLVFTHACSEEDIFQGLKAGARGYLSKQAPGETLVSAVRALHAGGRFFPAEIAERMSARLMQPELTRRERQVLDVLVDGASNRQIAEGLALSERTVALYVSSILEKLGARSRTQAVAIARRRGLIAADR